MPTLNDLFRPSIPLEQFSRFSCNMATCLAAGLGIPGSLTTCGRTFPNLELRAILKSAGKRTTDGMTLFDALEPHKNRFPAFFLPVLRCGEECGRLDEALRYLESHCRDMAEPARMMRNTWLVPLVMMLISTLICTAAYFTFAPVAVAFRYMESSMESYLLLGFAVGLAICVPPLRALCDQLRLFIPVIGPAERELTLNRFFNAMNLLYSTGGRRVETMIRLAAASCENIAIRTDFMNAAKVIESGGTIAEAFAAVGCLSLSYKASIMMGDEAGKLDDAFEMICKESSDAVVALLAGFQQVFFRIVAYSAMMTTVLTVMGLAMSRR